MVKKAAGAPAPEPEAQVEEQTAAPAPEPEAPAADPPPDAPAVDQVAQTALPDERVMTNWQPPTDVESLAAYAARIEAQAQPLPVCEITHPDAVDGTIHNGTYAGIRLVRGDTPAALLSDGTTI